MIHGRIRGVTLVEILVVIGVILILTAITVPVMSSAKRSAKVTATTVRLRNQWIALSLYRAEYDSDGRYGTSPEMGLPEFEVRNMAVIDHTWPPPCGIHPDLWVNFWVRCFCGHEGMSEEELNAALPKCRARISADSNLYRENWILLIDDNCSDPDVKLRNVYQRKRAVGVFLSGQVKFKVGIGDHLKPGWWANPE